MSGERCPHCGALVGADAEWCGQCLQPVGRGSPPERPAPAVPGAEGPDAGARRPEGTPGPADRGVFERVGDRMVWTCPTCELENPIESSVCDRCGTPFGELFRGPQERPAIPATRAAALSLLFPGIGHVAAGQPAQGVARGILFAWALASTIGLLVAGGGGSSSIYVSFLALYALAAAGLYAISAVDAYRAALGVPPLAPIRILFYAATGLMVATVAVLLLWGFGRAG